MNLVTEARIALKMRAHRKPKVKQARRKSYRWYYFAQGIAQRIADAPDPEGWSYYEPKAGEPDYRGDVLAEDDRGDLFAKRLGKDERWRIFNPLRPGDLKAALHSRRGKVVNYVDGWGDPTTQGCLPEDADA